MKVKYTVVKYLQVCKIGNVNNPCTCHVSTIVYCVSKYVVNKHIECLWDFPHTHHVLDRSKYRR